MINIRKFALKILLFGIPLLLINCHFHHDDHNHIDMRYPFLGQYHAEESFYNPNTNAHESFHYDIEIMEVHHEGLEIMVTGYGNGGIYGTNCSIVGTVNDGTHIDIPLNICHFDGLTDFEICGHGDLSADGHYLTFDLDIVRCYAGICNNEPSVRIEAHRY